MSATDARKIALDNTERGAQTAIRAAVAVRVRDPRLNSADLDVSLIDDAVEAYEQARLVGDTFDLAQFAPPADHPGHAAVACELMRVDLEYAWEAGEPKQVEDYCRVFAAALDTKAIAERVAFEEYRLRTHAGEAVSPAEFCERLGIDTSGWPDLTSALRNDAAAGTVSVSAGRRDADLTGLSSSRGGDFPEIPGKLLDFELVAELGRGAFARVYLARQSELAQRFVVLKVSRSFSDEPQRLAQLQHTNIVPIYSVHHVDANRVVCMPFFGGATLADLLAPYRGRDKLPTSGREFVSTLIAARDSTLVAGGCEPGRSKTGTVASEIPAARRTSDETSLLSGLERASYVGAVLALTEQLSDGLAHAHERGIVHRDLKPANVLVTDDGRAMLLDFNLAATTASDATADRSLGGTLAYMSPELLDAVARDTPPAAADPRGDVFGVGSLLFEMLTGRQPFPTYHGSLNEIAARMAADRRSPPPSLRAINLAVPRGVEAIVSKCLASDPADRYPSAVELHEDLLRQVQHLPLRHVREPSLVERAIKWTRRHPRLASGTTVGLAAVVLLAASIGAWWYRGEEIARRDAVAAATDFHRDEMAWRIPLGTHDLDARSLDDTLRTVRGALDGLGVFDEGGWRDSQEYRRLSRAEQARFDRDAAESCYLAAGATYRTALDAEPVERRAALDRALNINSAAIGSLAQSSGADLAPLVAALERQHDLLSAALAGKTPPTHAGDKADDEQAAPKSSNDVYMAALEHIAEADFARAVELVKPRVDADPQDYALRYALAQAYRGQGEFRSASDEFTACAALAPTSHVAYFYRGLCRLELEDSRGAEDDFSEVLRYSAGLPAAFINRAIARERQEDAAGAIDDLTAALANGATETRVFFLRARLYEKRSETAAAERDRQEGFRREPRDEASFIARGVARLPGDAEAALAEFRAVLARYGESVAARRNIAHVLSEHLGKPEEAIAELDAVVRRRPRDAAALVGRGVLHGRLGHRDDAHRDAEAALQSSRDPQTVYQAACVYALTAADSSQDMPRALKLLAEALLLDPRSARVAATDADMRLIAKESGFRRLLAAAAALDRATRAEVK